MHTLMSGAGCADLATFAAIFLAAGGVNLRWRRHAMALCGVQEEAPLLHGWGMTSIAVGIALAVGALNIAIGVYV